MDARALRYFQAVVEFGSYSRASEYLRISQPAISRQVSQLERELGKPLFIRSGHGATPTDAGRRLFEHSQSILRQLENAAAEIRSIHAEPTGTIALAVPPGAGHFLLPALVKRYRRVYPQVLLKVVAGFSGYIHEALVRGRVDVACLHGPMPQKGFDLVPLVDEEVFLVGKRGTLPANRTVIATADLQRLPLIVPSRSHSSRRLLDERAAAEGLNLNVSLEVDDPSLIRSLVRDGLGFSLLTQGAFHHEVARKELEAIAFRPRIHWPLALMTMAGRPRSELVDQLIATIRSTVCDLTADGSWPGKRLNR
jgi:LysR family transcriptional regulator, nitrogen assimilation regulatory protein